MVVVVAGSKFPFTLLSNRNGAFFLEQSTFIENMHSIENLKNRNRIQILKNLILYFHLSRLLTVLLQLYIAAIHYQN